ncbi:MAG: winged helix-turn-helix transcriptional regulator [Chloroflexi bacterium]|nr:winged helix-turn-helix transcriptional regulator [Chloroflexota bacterium]
MSNRSDFLRRLTAKERELAEALTQSPTATNLQIADRLGKSRTTVNKQFEHIYGKLAAYLDLSDTVPTTKRQLLISLLNE